MKKILYKVTCPKEHSFKHIVEVEEAKGGEKIETTLDLYCPFCDRNVMVGIDGVPVDDTVVHRNFGF